MCVLSQMKSQISRCSARAVVVVKLVFVFLAGGWLIRMHLNPKYSRILALARNLGLAATSTEIWLM